ncbi:hypothetical protein [Brevibacterium yomogidense]|uniref:hypothetical protein n=1 Tax=Brevibacterium yomogidense TaxID=946573 RepID=UPI0018DFD6D2|nr:hypothetical protein [Brevibacterium yomogidense]
MSIPPPPQHPPPRRQPQEPEDPSLTTQIFLDQARAATSGGTGAAEQGAGGSTGRSIPTDDAQTQALTPQGIAEARRLDAESGAGSESAAEPDADAGGESTRVLSMEELREIAASSRVEAIDGPREAGPQAEWAPRAGAQDEARAREQAAPGVFSTAMPPPQVPTFAVPPPVPPPVAPPAPPSAPSPSALPPAHTVASGRHPHVAYAAGTHDGTDLQGEEGRRPPQRRRMPALAIAFVVLSGLIVLGIGGWIVVDALSRSGDEMQQTAPPPATQESTGEGGLVDEADDASTPPEAADVESFVTPSGNIGCTIDAERARCIVQSFDYDPPDAPDGCTMDAWGSIVVANRDGAGFSCTPAPFPSDAEALDYGQAVSAHGMTCTSSETGVSCRSDDSGAAFSVARGSAGFDQP